MKRILPLIGTAFLACASQGASAIESDAVLDQFPTTSASAIDDVQDVRRGAAKPFATGVREVRGGVDETQTQHAGGRYRSHGSFIEVSALGGSVERGAFYGTAGTARNAGTANAPGIIVVNTAADLASLSAALQEILGKGAAITGPKVLDIEADRLDRRPYGADGLDVVYSGASKIIRISPDFGRAAAPEEAAEAPAPVADASLDVPPAVVYPDSDVNERPVDPPAQKQEAQTPVAEERVAAVQAPAPVAAPLPAPAPRAPAAAFLEPWTPEWLRDCVSRHTSFDASLGTYMADNGQRRFCTGEP